MITQAGIQRRTALREVELINNAGRIAQVRRGFIEKQRAVGGDKNALGDRTFRLANRVAGCLPLPEWRLWEIGMV
jgi:hypothetical protein